MGWWSRFVRRMGRSDEDILQDETREWADSVEGTTRIGSCPRREQVRLAGVVRRLTIKPEDGSLEAAVWDGTGEVTAVWTGRNQIPGLLLGTRVLLEGVLAREQDRPRIVNPRYEFAA